MSQIETLVLLVQLGVVGIQQVRDYLRQDVDDEAALAAILAEVDQRLARRAVPLPGLGSGLL